MEKPEILYNTSVLILVFCCIWLIVWAGAESSHNHVVFRWTAKWSHTQERREWSCDTLITVTEILWAYDNVSLALYAPYITILHFVWKYIYYIIRWHEKKKNRISLLMWLKKGQGHLTFRVVCEWLYLRKEN